MIGLDLFKTFNHSFTPDGHMNYLHFLVTTQSAEWKRTCHSLRSLLQAFIRNVVTLGMKWVIKSGETWVKHFIGDGRCSLR